MTSNAINTIIILANPIVLLSAEFYMSSNVTFCLNKHFYFFLFWQNLLYSFFHHTSILVSCLSQGSAEKSSSWPTSLNLTKWSNIRFLIFILFFGYVWEHFSTCSYFNLIPEKETGGGGLRKSWSWGFLFQHKFSHKTNKTYNSLNYINSATCSMCQPIMLRFFKIWR